MKKMVVILISVLAFVSCIPIAMTFVFSFEDGFTGYIDLLLDCFVFYRMFWNSLGYAVAITLVQLGIIILAAFALHFIRKKWTTPMFLLYVVLMMMPLQVTLLPNYIGLRDMKLLNTPWAIILPQIFSPFGVVVMFQYMKGISVAQMEACRLETNSIYQIIRVSILPQLKVCIFAVALFVFADAWNMVEQPMLFVKDKEWKTLSVFIAEAENYEGDILFPAAVICLIPALLLYGFFHDYLEQGLALGVLYEE